MPSEARQFLGAFVTLIVQDRFGGSPMLCSRHNSSSGVSTSACLSRAMTLLSVKLDFFHGTSSGHITRKFHF
jgi:hypothetical protein